LTIKLLIAHIIFSEEKNLWEIFLNCLWVQSKMEGENLLVEKEKKKQVKIHINPKWCKGCYICVEICPQKVLGKAGEISEKGFQQVVVVYPEKCTGCLQCEMLCPDLAINVEIKK